MAEDPLARKIRYLLRVSEPHLRVPDDCPIPVRYHAIAPCPCPCYAHLLLILRVFGVSQVVYSSELAVAKLTHLSQGHIDTPQEFGAVDNFRTGVLPVLGRCACSSAWRV